MSNFSHQRTVTLRIWPRRTRYCVEKPAIIGEILFFRTFVNHFQIATLCGSKPNKHRWNYFSKGQGMCVVMVTDKNSASSGFKANYQVKFRTFWKVLKLRFSGCRWRCQPETCFKWQNFQEAVKRSIREQSGLATFDWQKFLGFWRLRPLKKNLKNYHFFQFV